MPMFNRPDAKYDAVRNAMASDMGDLVETHLDEVEGYGLAQLDGAVTSILQDDTALSIDFVVYVDHVKGEKIDSSEPHLGDYQDEIELLDLDINSVTVDGVDAPELKDAARSWVRKYLDKEQNIR